MNRFSQKKFIINFLAVATALSIVAWKLLRPFEVKANFKPAPAVSADAASFTATIDEFFSAGESHLGFSGFVLVYQQGRIWSKGYGQVSPQDRRRPTSDTLFRIGSVTKPIVALSAMRLQHAKRLSLQDSVCRYQDCFCSGQRSKISMRDLLQHTSGLSHDSSSVITRYKYLLHYQNQDWGVASPYWEEVFCKDSIDEKLQGKFSYSNLGYIGLGLILQEIESKSLNQVLKETVFTPLLMQQTFLDEGQKTSAAPELAQGMVPQASPFSTSINYVRDTTINYASLGAAGAIASSASDLSNLLKAINESTAFPGFDWSSYLGSPEQGQASILVNEKKVNGNTLRWHNGSTAGFYSYIAMVPAEQTYFIVLSNIKRRSSRDVATFFSNVNLMIQGQSYKIPVP